MTRKQQMFIDEYLIDLNATQAAIRAGYSVKYADREGSRLVENCRVSAAISRAMAERSKRTGVTADRVIMELAKIGFVNIVDVVNPDEATIKGDADRDDTAAIQSIKVKRIPTQEGDIVEHEVKTHDKVKALDLLGRHLGIFNDKLKIEGGLTVNIVDDLED